MKKAKKDLIAAKKEETRVAEIAFLSKSIKELVEQSRKAMDEEVKGREMVELRTLLDHTQEKDKKDLVHCLDDKVRKRLGLPKPVPTTVGLANPSDDQSSVGC